MSKLPIRISKKLNLVITIELEDGSKIYVHSMPITMPIFDSYWEPIARAYTRIFATPLINVSGPKVAKRTLRKEAEVLGVWDGPSGVQLGLYGEIRRLTSVCLPKEGGGWEMLPYEIVLTRKLLDEESIDHLENMITFFILVSAIQDRKEIKPTLENTSTIWPLRPESLSATEFMTSLSKLTKEDDTGGQLSIALAS